MLLIGLAAGQLRPLRAEWSTAAATALVVLLAGYSGDGSMLLARLADTFVGIAVGLIVNLAVWPPLRDRGAARRIDALDDRLGALLGDIAAELRADDDGPDTDRWVERTRELDHEIDAAWADIRHASESGRMNLRRHAARRVADARGLGEILVGLEQAVADARSMARTHRPRGRPGHLGAAVPRRVGRGARPRPRMRSGARIRCSPGRFATSSARSPTACPTTTAAVRSGPRRARSC